MIQNIQWVTIKQIADRMLRHPLMQDLTLETIIHYTVDFINIMGFPALYEDKLTTIEIDNYRAKLPNDLLSINQIKDTKSKLCLRSSTDTFYQDGKPLSADLTFKQQGGIIYTSFKTGVIEIAYKSMPIDELGFPKIPDNTAFEKALEAYIKKEYFTILFELGKIPQAVLNNIQTTYSWEIGKCDAEFNMPSPSELESITNMWNQILPRVNEFQAGFKYLGTKEHLKF